MSDPQYFRDKSRENYRLKKELSVRFQTEGELGECFSDFVKRIKYENRRESNIS